MKILVCDKIDPEVLKELSLLGQITDISNDNNKDLIGNEFLFFNKKTKKPIENLRKSFTKYSKDLDWVVYPEALRKTFANICDRSNIPRTHFYQLLGLKKAYNLSLIHI